jgi:hypothetical protein
MICIGPKRCAKKNNRIFRLVLCAAVLMGLFSSPIANAQGVAASSGASRQGEEKADCQRNLKLIYAAIQAYKTDHKDIPNWLSDLVPQYLADTSVLICPVCKRTGETETSPLADPKIPCSYTYQFSPVPIGRASTHTWRDWKRRQMGLAGSSVPLICCAHHGAVINVSFDGRIYESDGAWESTLAREINIADLTPEKIFANDSANGLGANDAPTFPPRDSQATPNQIDLGAYYNVRLTDSWLSGTNNNLAELPVGTQVMSDVTFDVRGLIQLAGARDTTKHFPTSVKGIRVGQKCARLHFLGAAAFGNVGNNDAREIGYYVAHMSDGKELNIPIVYARDVCDWYSKKGDAPSESGVVIAWTGSNKAIAGANRKLRLFASTWENPTPGTAIENIDFVSHADGPAPFLVAISAD